MKDHPVYHLVRLGAALPFAAIILVLTGCDPMKSILILNKTGKNIRLSIQQDSTHLLSMGEVSSREFKLSGTGENSQARHIYGFGGFSKNELQAFNLMIKEIRIETHNDTCRISGGDLLKYLPKKRLGVFNNTLKLEVENCP